MENGLVEESRPQKTAVCPIAVVEPKRAVGDIHRIGGGSIENLRLKPAEATLEPPGISVLKGGSPAEAAEQMKAAFPGARKLLESARVVGSTTEDAIRYAGFDVMPDPTRRLPNHFRITHPDGAAGFVDGKLDRLSRAFVDTVMEEP
ncbi:hypothetical protein [Paludisphaera rhizosphaerae]|uniref:hypothetical protein n=1 Tax=Paludisphaera rhizosphaerae TaxID=2711216 RepID=UPI0013EB43AF|nr:hypothetical protein [Paludisphaera rhizosphaerae]